VDQPVNRGVGLAHPVDLGDGVQGGGVVLAAEQPSDLGK
jgi:hypothetical protein